MICLFKLFLLPIVTEGNYQVVLKLLMSERARWESLGTMLGVHIDVLEAIKKSRSNSGGCEESFHAMLSKWLEKNSNVRTWENLRQTLEAFHYNVLASSLSDRKGTGKMSYAC